MAWYAYINGDPLIDASYRRLPLGYTLDDPPGCSTGCRICAIFLNQMTEIPTGIDPLVQSLIPTALATGIPQRLTVGIPAGPYYVLLRC